MDDRPKALSAQEVDSIPVVRLDDMPSPEPSVADVHLSSLRAAAQPSSSPTSFVIEREGEMPEGATTRSSPSAQLLSAQYSNPTPPLPRSAGSGSASGSLHGSHSPYATPVLSSFQQYDVPESDLRTATPEPIKVVRSKKAGTKKKRTKPADLDN
jgi:AP-3 complex subunit delta-1